MTKKTRKGTVMNVEIAQRLAELRRERGFSQEDLANQLGLSRQAVSKWERAESAPDMGNLIALADLYEVTIDELLRVSPEVEEDMRFESQERVAVQQPPFAQGAPYGAPRPASTMSPVPPGPMVPPTAPMPAPAPAPAPKDPLQSFPYPLLCALLFLMVGFCFGWWHPGWVIFLTIPFWYWIVNVLEDDPGFRQWKAERAERMSVSSANPGDEGGAR